jgi:hypothetical protein
VTRNEMAHFLRKQYRDQCEKFPRTREIGEGLYLNTNLSHMLRSPYWRNRPIDGYPKDYERRKA